LSRGNFVDLIRLDRLVVEKTGFSRDYAVEVIVGGSVSAGGKALVKPGMKVSAALEIEVAAQPMRYVSRGGYKLEHAIEAFEIDVEGSVCVDIGASVGGFTDCLLQNGARFVAAVDCGSGQLAEKLRNDPRVAVYENMNIRNVDVETFIGGLAKVDEEGFDLVVIDVSFISLTLVLPVAASLLKQKGTLICLVKPQFEVGKKGLNKTGIVTDERLRMAAVEKVKNAAMCNFQSLSHMQSPITGRDGNVEYLLTGERQ